VHTAYSQSAAQVTEAKAKLGTMTPDEIEAAVKKYGMTMEEAKAKASAVGIDLESYLKSRAGDTTPAAQPQTQVNIQVAPTQVTPNTNAGQPTGQTPGVQPPVVLAPTVQTPVVQTPVIQPPVVQAPVVQAPVVQAPVVQAPVVQAPEPPKPPQEAALVTGPEGIPYFGYNLFKAGPNAFEPRPNLADNLYIVGEGDVLRIALWGDTQSMYEYTVDTEGRILIQPAGPVLVAGYTLDQAKARVIRALSQSLAGLVARPPTTFLDLTIARLRPVRTFVMGEVANPGTYTLSSFATVFNALFTVGGPLVSGDMREVRLVRNGKTAAKVDLYDYLIGSEKTGDVRVNDNDIIYVPLRGRTVGIKGAVLRSAYFELLPNEQLKRLLEFSGGIRNTFYLQRIQVDRIVPFAERKKGEPDRKFFDINFEELLTSNKDYKLEDGDIITVFPILAEKKNFVILEGAVWRPGTYQLEKISTLKDLIDAADGLLPEAYLDRAEVTRTFDDKHLEALNVNIGKAMKGDRVNNIALQPRDKIRVYSKYELNALRSVTINGHVKNPGKYPYADSLTLYDLVYIAGGMNDSLYRAQTYEERANLIRLNPDLVTKKIIPFHLGHLYDFHEGNMQLEADDEIRVFSRDEMLAGPGSVTVEGMAKRPGTYQLQTNLTLYDLIHDAVGLTDTLFRKQVYLGRADLVRLNEDRYTSRIVPFDLWNLFENREGDTLLLSGDRVIIFPISTIEFTERYVDIAGKVKSPGRYKLSENMTLFDLLIQAGGYTEDAWAVQAELARLERTGLGKDSLSRITFARLPDLFDTSKINPEAIANFRSKSIRLQHRDQVFIRSNPKYMFQQSVTVDGEVEHPGTYVLAKLNERLSSVINRAGGVKNSGYAEGGRVIRVGTRLRINVYDAIDDPEGNNDIKLQPGDIISIPSSPYAVQVNGEVNNPGLFSFVDGKKLSFYLDESGGETDSAYFALVTFPTGMVEQFGLSWWSENPKIPDGSSIFVVKEKPEPPEPITAGPKTTTFDFIKDVFAITVSAVTIIVLASKL
jgi:protein involved in polysaccharide export with SLBB domain